jgi:hypothetical protein
MMKSSVDTAVPYGVATLMWPDPVFDGTVADSVVDVPLDTPAYPMLNRVRSFGSTVSKFVPVIDTAAPGSADVGVNDVMVGARLPVTTVKGVALVADPAGDVTAIVPVVAPDGTVTTSSFALAPEIVAAVPLKLTVFELGVEENPVPLILTMVPIDPLRGANAMTEIAVDAVRSIASRLPTAS